MAEPEDLLIEAARRLTEWTRGRLFAQVQGDNADAALDTHRERLSLLVRAACGRRLEIRTAETPPFRSLMGRWFGERRAQWRERRPLPSGDGVRLWLPPSAPDIVGLTPAKYFRLLALHQALRPVQGEWPDSTLAQDFVLMNAAAKAERLLARIFPALNADFTRLRASCLRERRSSARMSPAEREMEGVYRRLLAGDFACVLADEQRRLYARIRKIGGRYGGVRRDGWLGTVPPIADDAPHAMGVPPTSSLNRTPRVSLSRTPRARRAQNDEDDDPIGPWMIQTSEPLAHAEDARGLQRPPDQGDTDPQTLADALSELPELRLAQSSTPAREQLMGESQRDGAGNASRRADQDLCYPEWDWRDQTYRYPGVSLVVREPCEGDPEWAHELLVRRAGVVTHMRRQMRRLRPQRLRMHAQPDGDELDLDACIRALAERRGAGTSLERLYVQERASRRHLALTLLLDISGSTDAWIGRGRRGIDVARESLLLIASALAGLGIAHNVLAFSGDTPGRITVFSLKSFQEDRLDVTARRIAALESQRFTRTGGALRHATALLISRREKRRALLLISDGKPYDADQYGSRYGVEDTRRAVLESRLAGMHCFCLTVDREAPHYLPAMFGPGGYRLLRDASELPRVTAHLLRAWAK